MVTFLNPLFLLGLAGVAVPALIHLSKRGEAERTVFPAAALLMSSAQVVRRRRSPVEILLLILRVLVVVGFLLALARPRVPAWGTPRDEKTLASAAIVIDDTPSMGLRFAAGRTRMEEGVAAAAAVLDRLAAGSVVRVQAASGLVLDSEVDLAAARAKLEAVTPSAEAVPLGRALSDAVKWLASAPAPRELYVISDFQRSSWEDAKGLPPWSDVRAHFVDLGRDAPGDWGVTSVRVVEDRVFRKVPFELRVRVRAGSNATRELALS
ncbi:MAG: BatA domain-containing protein, partial [Planctomycetota bacterium]